jgi:hypothetical protein
MPDTLFPLRHPPVEVPPAPDLAVVSAALQVRLHSITHDVLPVLRRARDFLASVWASDDADAVALFGDDGVPIFCDPHGVDHLATVLAEEDALAREQAALLDLADAIGVYEAGGRLTLMWLDDTPEFGRRGQEAAPVPRLADADDMMLRPPMVRLPIPKSA